MALEVTHNHGDTNYIEIGSGCPSSIHKPATPDPPFRFMDLPGELQNTIVDDFIVSNDPIVIRLPRFNRRPSPPPTPIAHPRFDKPVLPTPPASRSQSIERDRQLGHSRLALMLTCKQLYREHWRTYYGDNLFVFNMDIFRDYAQNMPLRCWQNVRKIAFKMPHRHHHEGIWKMFGTMKSLEEIQLWLSETTSADETVREAAIQGVKGCNRLRSFIIRRMTDEEGEFKDLKENDKELQTYIETLLESRKTGKPLKDIGPLQPARKLTDPFVSSSSAAETNEDT